jgi:hypothetical protein
LPQQPRRLPKTIPDAIEGAEVPHATGDALDGVAVMASQRVQDGGGCPFVLVATRTNDGTPRAQLRRRDLAQPGTATAGWLEIGDGPAPGWHLLSISRDDVLLLTPQGSPLRLRMAASNGSGPGGSSTAPIPVGSAPARH